MESTSSRVAFERLLSELIQAAFVQAKPREGRGLQARCRRAHSTGKMPTGTRLICSELPCDSRTMPTNDPHSNPQPDQRDQSASDPFRGASVPSNAQGITVGDPVLYSRRFLRSIGASTGDMPHARGQVTAISQVGRSITLASITWNKPELPDRVNVQNLVRADRIHLDE